MTSFTSIPPSELREIHLESDFVRVERVLHLGRGYFCFPATMKNRHDFTLVHIIYVSPGMSIHYHPLSSIIIIIHYHPLSSIVIHYTPSKYSVHLPISLFSMLSSATGCGWRCFGRRLRRFGRCGLRRRRRRRWRRWRRFQGVGFLVECLLTEECSRK